jgi:hypothetical protein
VAHTEATLASRIANVLSEQDDAQEPQFFNVDVVDRLGFNVGEVTVTTTEGDEFIVTVEQIRGEDL